MMYPTYRLEYKRDDAEWAQVPGTAASDRPHHYDALRKTYEGLILSARVAVEAGVSYRIARDDTGTVDRWTSPVKQKPGSEVAVMQNEPWGQSTIILKAVDCVHGTIRDHTDLRDAFDALLSLVDQGYLDCDDVKSLFADALDECFPKG